MINMEKDTESFSCLSCFQVIFFLVTGIVLSLGYGMKIKLATHWCFKWKYRIAKAYAVLLVRKLGVHNQLRGCNQDSWPKLAKGILHTIGCHAVSLSGEQPYCASLVLCIFCICCYFPCIFCPIKLPLPQPMSFTFFSNSLPHATKGEWAVACSCLLG